MSHDDGTSAMLSLYEEIARLTAYMLSAAHQNDWDSLRQLEAGCATCIDSLKNCQAPARLSDSARQQKVELIKLILANDRELRQLTEPWMQRIGHLLDSPSRQHQLARSYREEG